jgi:hypothetical protein
VRRRAANEPLQLRIIGALDGLSRIFGGKRGDGAVGTGRRVAAGQRRFMQGNASRFDCGFELGVAELDVIGRGVDAKVGVSIVDLARTSHREIVLKAASRLEKLGVVWPGPKVCATVVM